MSTGALLRSLGDPKASLDDFALTSALSGTLFMLTEERELILLSDMALALGVIEEGPNSAKRIDEQIDLLIGTRFCAVNQFTVPEVGIFDWRLLEAGFEERKNRKV